MKEIIDDRNTGLLFSPSEPEELASSMMDLLSDEKKTSRMGRNARSRVMKRFTWKLAADRVRKVYTSI